MYISVPGSAEQIWKGVSSVSKAGQKRGRGKIRGKKVIKDLNRGQIIGIGKCKNTLVSFSKKVAESLFDTFLTSHRQRKYSISWSQCTYPTWS